MHSIVLANGVFDLLHVGHIRHLQEARSMGSLLVVGVTMDDYTGKKYRPIIPAEQRVEMVKALRCVYDAFLCKTGLEALERAKPAIFAKGYDREISGLHKPEADYCAQHGIEVRYTKPNRIHTGQLIERIRQCEFA